MKILLTGGSGLLGKELQKHLKVDAPSHKDFDILNPPKLEGYDLIINAAAYTNVEKAETEREECFNVNVLGTLRISDKYDNIPLVYISTEYAHLPVNWYSRTKQIAESIALDHPAGCLAIRTLFKPYPWPFEYAFKDQWTQGGYVNEIAPRIAKLIQEWDKKSKLVYCGTGRKTMYELARETKPDVIPNSIKDMKVKLPSDYK